MKRAGFIILLCMFLLPACGPRGPSKEEIATLVAEQVATQMALNATLTPSPTFTPSPTPEPTNTATPIRTPTPTRVPSFTPMPDPSAGVDAYLARMRPVIDKAASRILDGMDVIEAAIESDDPGLLCTAAFGDVTFLWAEAETITPPNEAGEFHRVFTDALFDWTLVQGSIGLYCIEHEEFWLQQMVDAYAQCAVDTDKAFELLTELTD